MNGSSPPGTENQPGHPRPAEGLHSFASPETLSPLQQPPGGGEGLGQLKTAELKVGKSLPLTPAAGQSANLDVFTLTLGQETIELLPFKNWGQLDHFKWTVRGKLPQEPAGLDITPDHVKLLGESISLTDPAGCEKLERLFNEWLRFERETLELARKKAHGHERAAPEKTTGPSESRHLSFKVEVDKRGQVHIHSLRGRETLASVGLTITGINSLHQQGLMRKPQSVQIGALHDWVELDGELFSFEKGRNDAARLEQILNEKYVPPVGDALAKEVVVFVNAASSTGFDIQFPFLVGGVAENRRRHLDDHSLESLQDPEHCGLLHKEIIAKLVPPNLVFKQRTPDGGEQYLAWAPEHTLTLTDEAGRTKTIALSQPMNLLRLSAQELMLVFNHPAINRHTQTGPQAAAAKAVQAAPSAPPPEPIVPEPEPVKQDAAQTVAPPPEAGQPSVEAAGAGASTMSNEAASSPTVEPEPMPSHAREPLPNLWLGEVVHEPALQHDWFACLVYTQMAEHFGNSTEGKFGPGPCWFISLGASEDITDPTFKGIFLTEKGSLGFLNEGEMARFYNGVAFIGARQAALEALRVTLLAVGLDAAERVVFLVSENYRPEFGVPEPTLADVLEHLRQYGAVVMSLTEALASHEPLEMVWTVPAEQRDPNQPEAVMFTRLTAFK